MRRSSAEALARWLATQSHSASVADLQRAVGSGGPSSPCLSGCRSVCWKIFLLSRDGADGADCADDSWSQALREGRDLYTKQNQHFLKFIVHPDALAQESTDPLADDPKSPWNTIREDETIRAEILQDVQRLPDEANYHEDRFQLMILDILFIYCKAHPERGGYRQGMHELLAPIVYAIEEDAFDRQETLDDEISDEAFLETIDASFIEHDAYVLFSRVMERAHLFYAVKDVNASDASQPPRLPEQASAIVERSKFIHEVCLQKVDPELAEHLTNTEILPQIFLIRWIRLLFSREFPFTQVLGFWDTIFAHDPGLDLVDLICCAMLIRIRWQLLEGDYAMCLQLLLQYPTPADPHGPQTFVDDALFLRENMSQTGGASLIMKYTGKAPKSLENSDAADLGFLHLRALGSLRPRGLELTSPLSFPPKFLQQQGGVETLFHGVLEKGEKLGIGRAVRDAIGEIRQNMHGLAEDRQSPIPLTTPLGVEEATALAAKENRKRQSASYFDESVKHLKAISAPHLEDKATYLEVIGLAASKMQFAHILLQDSNMEAQAFCSVDDDVSPEESIEEAAEFARMSQGTELSMLAREETSLRKLTMDETRPPPPPPLERTDEAGKENLGIGVTLRTIAPMPESPKRDHLPPAPVRSPIAESSYSWMLEPDKSRPSPAATPFANESWPLQRRKHGVNNASREKNAFLFGESVPTRIEEGHLKGTGGVFGMELPRPKVKCGLKENHGPL